MPGKTNIAWATDSWNPVTGCSKVSQGCRYCYALRDWPRLSAPRPKPNVYTGRAFTDVQFHPERLDQPLRWRKPRRIFVNSMSDLFHEKMDFDHIADIFAVMGLCFVMDRGHVFQILTKRPETMRLFMSSPHTVGFVTARMKAIHPGLPGENAAPVWPLPNVWLGVSVEDQETADERIPLLLQTLSVIRWVSYEPALGPVDFRPYLAQLSVSCCPVCGYRTNRLQDMKCPNDGASLGADTALDWVVVGGESGATARPFDIDWALSTAAQCKAAGVACFVKQLGAKPHVYGEPLPLADRAGADPSEWPLLLQVQEYPTQGD